MNLNKGRDPTREYIRVVEKLTRYRMVYLATPYTHYSLGLDWAAEHAARVAARLIQDGIRVFAPIPHTHLIASAGGLDPRDQALWLDHDAPMMDACDALCVAQMPGWKTSEGISFEIKTFCAANKAPYFLPVDWLLGEGA